MEVPMSEAEPTNQLTASEHVDYAFSRQTTTEEEGIPVRRISRRRASSPSMHIMDDMVEEMPVAFASVQKQEDFFSRQTTMEDSGILFSRQTTASISAPESESEETL